MTPPCDSASLDALLAARAARQVKNEQILALEQACRRKVGHARPDWNSLASTFPDHLQGLLSENFADLGLLGEDSLKRGAIDPYQFDVIQSDARGGPAASLFGWKRGSNVVEQR